MTVLKFKKHVHLRRREPRQRRLPMSGEPKRVYLGTVDTTDTGGAIVLPAGLDNAPVDEIRAAIEAAEIAKREAAKRESEVLREQFLGEKPVEAPAVEAPPVERPRVQRDWAGAVASD